MSDLIDFEKARSEAEKKEDARIANKIKHSLLQVSKDVFDEAISSKAIHEYVVITYNKYGLMGFISSMKDGKEIIPLLKNVIKFIEQHRLGEL